MTIKRGILCEILFNDNKTGSPTSLVGRIDKYQLEDFNTNINNFISFTQSCYPPIFKDDIEDIIIYNDEDGINYHIEHGKLAFSKENSGRRKAKVS